MLKNEYNFNKYDLSQMKIQNRFCLNNQYSWYTKISKSLIKTLLAGYLNLSIRALIKLLH
ncbi:hypothetical protein GCM10022292_27770 [Winogradskyella damuponensis]|uniref:Uncharacterized protein n=1 Tax=Winogradskyella damuponensis TaxID=943939 RepID=A0ABP8D0W5_9FLAO